MFSLPPIELCLSVLEIHANFSRDIISHTFSCWNGTSYETSVWYGKVDTKTEADQYFYYSLKFNLRDSRHKDWPINYQLAHDWVRLEIFEQSSLF